MSLTPVLSRCVWAGVTTTVLSGGRDQYTSPGCDTFCQNESAISARQPACGQTRSRPPGTSRTFQRGFSPPPRALSSPRWCPAQEVARCGDIRCCPPQQRHRIRKLACSLGVVGTDCKKLIRDCGKVSANEGLDRYLGRILRLGHAHVELDCVWSCQTSLQKGYFRCLYAGWHGRSGSQPFSSVNF